MQTRCSIAVCSMSGSLALAVGTLLGCGQTDPAGTAITDVATTTEAVVAPDSGSDGLRQVAVIMVHFGSPDDVTLESMREAVFDGPHSANALLREMSFGKAGLTGNVFGWFQVEAPVDANTLPIAQQGEAAVAALGIDLSSYEHLAFYNPYTDVRFPGGVAFEAAAPNQPERYSWYNGWYGAEQGSIFAHELLHNLGLDHAGGLNCNAVALANMSSCQAEISQDIIDLMGSRMGQISAYSKAQLGWLEPCNVVATPKSGEFDLVPTELASPGIQTLRVPANSALCPADLANDCYYYLEYRQPVGLLDSRLQGYPLFDGALVRLGGAIDPTGTKRAKPTWMIDPTPGTGYNSSLYSDARIAEGTALVDPYGVELRVLSRSESSLRVRVTVPNGSGTSTCLDGTAYGKSTEPTLEVKLRVLSDWQSGYCGDLRVTNRGALPMDGWRVTVDFTDGAINSSWNANYHPSTGGLVEVTPMPYNRVIYPASTMVTGFCATKLGPGYIPEVLSALSGT